MWRCQICMRLPWQILENAWTYATNVDSQALRPHNTNHVIYKLSFFGASRYAHFHWFAADLHVAKQCNSHLANLHKNKANASLRSCLILSCIIFQLILSYLVLYCIGFHCIVLFCIVLSCIVLNCIVLSCIVLDCIASGTQYGIQLYGIVPYSIVFDLSSGRGIVLDYIACGAQYCIQLYCAVMYCIADCIVPCCIWFVIWTKYCVGLNCLRNAVLYSIVLYCVLALSAAPPPGVARRARPRRFLGFLLLSFFSRIKPCWIFQVAPRQAESKMSHFRLPGAPLSD